MKTLPWRVRLINASDNLVQAYYLIMVHLSLFYEKDKKAIANNPEEDNLYELL
jgi:hypothetical protein